MLIATGPDNNPIEVQADANGNLKTSISGSLPKSEMDIYGSTIADRPLASAVAVGTMFKAVTTQEVWQSNGTDWVVIV